MRARWSWLLIASALAALPAPASDASTELRAFLEQFQAHRRIAIGYLRTDNPDLGAVEIERLRDRWAADLGRLPPKVLADRSLASAIAETERAVLDSLNAVDGGNVDRARALLESAEAPLKAWRQANGVRLFSDCIAEAGAAYEQLDVHRVRPPDLMDLAMSGAITAAAVATEAALLRCDGEAPDDIRAEPEFRRLVDGMSASLRQVSEAVQRRDGAYLHRLLIEQRSFERLLSFRYG